VLVTSTRARIRLRPHGSGTTVENEAERTTKRGPKKYIGDRPKWPTGGERSSPELIAQVGEY
jgi:hypothetical protein